MSKIDVGEILNDLPKAYNKHEKSAQQPQVTVKMSNSKAELLRGNSRKLLLHNGQAKSNKWTRLPNSTL